MAILDYESSYDKSDKIKYLNYLTGVANRYQKEKRDCPQLRMIVIYTGDISRGQVSNEYNIGAVKLSTETALSYFRCPTGKGKKRKKESVKR